MTTPSMSGTGSYLALPALTNTHHELRLDVEFKPLAPDGILVFSGGKSGPVEDFVSLAMVGGHLEFRYELGSGERGRPRTDGLWVPSCAPPLGSPCPKEGWRSTLRSQTDPSPLFSDIRSPHGSLGKSPRPLSGSSWNVLSAQVPVWSGQEGPSAGAIPIWPSPTRAGRAAEP